MATEKQKEAIKNVVENRGNVSKAMRDAGYSKKTAKNPKNLTESKTWEELMNQYLPDDLLAQKHNELLKSTCIEHMVFPLNITDKEIKELLNSVNCEPRKYQHSEQATHVWFWARDNMAIKNALDLAYKLKGSYAPEKKDITSKGEPIKQINYITPNGGDNNQANG